MSETDYTRFSTKDMLVAVVLPRLESIDRKLDSKADIHSVSALGERVTELERHGSAHARDLEAKVDSLHKRIGVMAALETVIRQGKDIESLAAWRNRIVGAVSIIAPLTLAALGLVLSRIF